MRIIKTAEQHRPYPKKQALSTLFSKNGCCLFILIFLFQFFPSFFFLQGGSLVWALVFQDPPRVIDDVDEDTVFSPNGDGVQDILLISFITDGDIGDFRIIIDTHGPSGVGAPDGYFRVDEDWVITGELGLGIDEEDNPKAIREAWDGNDFSRQQEDKNPHLLNDGKYRIQIEIDSFPNEEVNRRESGYRSVRLSAIIDNTSPQLSAIASQQDLSPNGDTIIDETQINYGLSEDLAELELQFTDPSYRPAVPLTRLTKGNHSFTWDGADGLGTTLSDGVYTAQLHGTDKGGNVGTFGIGTIQIDTKPPIIAQLTPNRNSFQNTVEQIEAIFDVDDGSLIDVDSAFTRIVLENADGAQINGFLSHDEEAGRITLTLDRLLNSSDDNGVYTINVSGADKAGNIIRDEVNFTFDNIAPTIASIATDAGELTPDTSATTKFTFLDVTLADNIDSRVNTSSTILLSGLEGAVVAGIQSQFGENGIRWTPGFPLPTDGSGDGDYTITVQSRDRAGNEVEIQIPFIYDTQVPELISLTSETGIQLNPSEGAKTFLNSSLSVVTAIFDDENGGGVDFSKTSIRIVRFDQVEGLPIPLPVLVQGSVTVDEDNDTLELRLTQPLERRNGSQDGTYRIEVRLTDKAGNTQTKDFDIAYDTQVPAIVSTTPAENETVSSLSQVSVVLNAVSGVDFSATGVRLLRADGSEVNTEVHDNGRDTVSLTLAQSLAIDGSGDGEYTIEITPVDGANNAGATVGRQFFVASRIPEIRLNTPTETRINNLTTIDVQMFDYIGPGLDFSESKSTVTVSRNGVIVEARPLIADEDNMRLIWTIDRSLSRNGSADGEYTVSVQYTDLIGETLTEDFILTFDSQPPTITVGSRPQIANPLTTGRIEVELEVTDNFADVQGSGFDASASTFELFDANGTIVDGAQTDDGISRFAFRSEVLPEDGVYTLVVTLVDRAGNRSIPQPFIYDAEEPTIEAVSHIDPTATVSNVGEFLTRVEATVSDAGTGIDFDRSLIQLLNAAGEVIPGSPYHDNESTIGWVLETPLTREGNFDGLYSLRVSAVDKAGYVEEKTFAIRYDTQVPTIHNALVTNNDGTPIELFAAEAQLITSPINRIAVRFSDGAGSGMDVLRTTVSLIGPEGMSVGTNQSDNGVDIVYLSFNPLRADGSDDGLYRVQVTPTDLAGNTLTSPIEFQFFYGTREPEVVSTTPAEFASVTQFTEVSAILQDYSGGGIDFNRAAILLKAPDQSPIPGYQTVDEAQSSITWQLSQPLSRDGSADGEYTIQLSLVDKAGNRTDIERTFVYDTLIPTIASVTANTNPPIAIPSNRLTAIETSFDGLTITLSDTNGETTPVSGIDLVSTDVQLLGPGNTPFGINTRDNGVDAIIVSFASLYQPGTYTLEITPRDMAGNVSSHATVYEFSLELGYATVSAVTIGGQMAPVEFVNQLDEIVATLEDVSATGLNLTSDGSTIVVTGPNGEVEGVQTSRGTNQIAWRPLQLATDGSADGVYTATVTPVNSGDRLGIPARYQFTLDTQEPEVTSVTPIDLTQPLSYIGQQIVQIAAQIEDVGPAGLEVEDQRLQLLDAGGNPVPAIQSDDGDSQIFLTLSQPLTADGSDDGVYTVTLELMDKAGNLNPLSHQLVYDTQAPTLVSTDPTDGDLRSDDITLITANLNDLGDSGIDFAASVLTLLDPTGTPINGTQSNNGNRRLTLQINGLVADGNYTIRVEAIDRAGNGSNAPFETYFTFSSGMPVVVSTVPQTTPAEQAFTNEPFRQVEVEFLSDDGDANRSTIALLAPDGTTLPGQQVRQGKMLIYRLLRELATDGSDDGTYTILVVPVNSAGRQGVPEQFTFVYDTVAPEVDPTSIQLLVAEPDVNNSLVSVGALITDDESASGVDWDNLDESWIALDDVRRNRKIDGTLATDEDQALLLNLIMPLASDGSQDGIYLLTIAPKDRAGNATEPIQYLFFYDTRAPMIDTGSLFIDGQPLLTDSNDPYYPSATSKNGGIIIDAKFSDINPDGSFGLGADLVNSSITVRSPAGNAISGTTTQNGIDSIRFKSGPLDEQGFYQVTITSVGLDAGNLGVQPTDSITTQFLFETTKPVVELTDLVGEITFEDEPFPLQGTARDPSENDIPASEVALVEVVGTGPDGLPINPVAAKDDSEEEEDPWSRWSVDFLPSQSGEYNLDIRVSDRAGNIGLYDAATVNFSVSLIFKGPTYVWPNPLSLSRRSSAEVAHFSFEVNVPGGEGARIVLSIYDFAGDLVYEKSYSELSVGRSDDEVMWDLTNQSGVDVARGIYIFRLEAEDVVTSNRTNAVGKIVVVE